MSHQPQDILRSLDQRVENILGACTECGACVAVCPTPGIDGFDATDPEQITGGILEILRTGSGPKNAELWAQGCCNSGFCKSACEHGINPEDIRDVIIEQLLGEQNLPTDPKDHPI